MAFPNQLHNLRLIAQAHREQDDEPLLLALYYDDPDFPDYESMLEVYDGYDQNRVSPNKELLTTAFGTAASGFAVVNDVSLRLLITNPAELRVGLDERWLGLRTVRAAVRSGRSEIVYEDASRRDEVMALFTEGQPVA